MDLTQYEKFTWEFFKRQHPEAYEKAHCFECDSVFTELFVKNDVLRIVQCLGCGLVYQTPQPTQGLLDKFYSSSIAMNIWADIKKVDLERQKNKYQQAIAFLKDMGIKNIFDVGCGNGVFLRLLLEADPTIDAYGCELNDKARTITKFHGLNVLNADLDAALRGVSNHYDAISMWGVLEHVKNPDESIELCARALKKNGFLVVCVPNEQSTAVKELKEKCFTFCPQHLWYFSFNTLKPLLSRHGLEVERHFSVEPEAMPVLRNRLGLEPYERSIPMAANSWQVYNLERDTILTKSGYKIVLIAAKV